MKKLIFVLIAFFSVLFAPGVLAQQCSVSVSASSTQDFLNEVTTLNGALSNCPQQLPSPLSTLFGNENVEFEITMQDGSIETIIFTTTNGQLSGVSAGGSGSGYKISISQCGLDTALREDSFEVYGQLWDSGDLRITANGFFKRALLTILRPFVGRALPAPVTPYTISCSSSNPSAVAGPTGKPDFCDETFLPGHSGYAENQALWDSYSADTDGVCQSQFGRGVPSPCVHTVQLSLNGNPYYLCWYNE